MAKEKKWTDAMENLRLYMVNTECIYDCYHKMVEEIVLSGKKIIGGKHRKRMTEIARDAVGMYLREIGQSVGRIGKNQIAAVGAMILTEDLNETWDFYQKHGEF